VTGTVSWNDTYATVYGRPSETSESWQWWIDRIHPEDRERTSGGLRSAISGSESTWTCEYRFQRVDGAWAYIYDRAYIARDPSGSAWRVIGAMQISPSASGPKLSCAKVRNASGTSLTRFRFVIRIFGPDGAVTFTNHFGLNFVGGPWSRNWARDGPTHCIPMTASALFPKCLPPRQAAACTRSAFGSAGRTASFDGC